MRVLNARHGVAAAAAIGALTMAGAAAPAAHQRPAAHQAPASTTRTAAPHCPHGILPLPANGVPRAADRALAQAATLYPHLNTRAAEVMAADRTSFAGARGRGVRSLCGTKAAARTVVVQMLFPRMLPSASLSQAVVLAGRFGHGYRVWYILH